MQFIKSQGRGLAKGSMVGPGGSLKQRDYTSLLQVLLKLTLTYGKGGTR
jgi:hypothetical protein